VLGLSGYAAQWLTSVALTLEKAGPAVMMQCGHLPR
jgi:hypothetical protein